MSKIIRLPFKPEMLKQIRNGIKTATSRPKQMAQVGDIFQDGNSYYLITNVSMRSLGEICMNHYKEEGCESPQHFISIWNNIHYIRGFIASQIVYYHEFRKAY